MHVRWRGLELPAQVLVDENSRTDTFGRFTIEPFERGFGTTIGNSLRRVLLSSIEGAAITKVQIQGVEHEFSTMPGVMEDVTDIILNIKGLIISLDSDTPKTIRLAATGPGEVTADLIEADTSVTIHNPSHVIATLTDEVDFEAEFTVARGRGYQPASEEEVRQAALKLHKEFGTNVIVTLGKEGAIAVVKDGSFFIHPVSVPVVSSAGAGDGVLAGMALAYLHRESLEYGLKHGFALAGAILGTLQV